MPEADPLRFLRRWGAVSISMLILGLLIAVPSGLCVGQAAYDLYVIDIRGYVRGEAGLALFFGVIVFAFGLLILYGAFRSRIDPDDE